MILKPLTILGILIFLVGLAWFAHISYTLTSYVLSVATMGVGVLLAFAGSARWRDNVFSIRRHFRRR